MAEPARDEIVEEVVTVLAAIGGTSRDWGGQYPGPFRVERQWRPIELVTEFPHLIVSMGSGSELTQIGVSGHYLDEIRVLVYGYVRGDDVVPASRWLLRLQDDVINELLKAPKLNAGAAAIARSVVPREDETDDGLFEPLAAFRQGFSILQDAIKAVA